MHLRICERYDSIHRMSKDQNMTVRTVVPMTPEMDETIKDYWHEHRLNSKADAIRTLIEAGLKAEGKRLKK
jgi:hypothetical protein